MTCTLLTVLSNASGCGRAGTFCCGAPALRACTERRETHRLVWTWRAGAKLLGSLRPSPLRSCQSSAAPLASRCARPQSRKRGEQALVAVI